MDMKRVSLTKGALHVETPNGIVNIRVGLEDALGRSVDSIEVIPDNYAGEPKVLRRGFCNTRLVRCLHAKGGG